MVTEKRKKQQDSFKQNLQREKREYEEELNKRLQKVYNKPDCPCLLSEDTRFSNPIDNYRSMSLTSYHYTPYLIINPLSKFQNLNEKHGLSSRIISKDTFKLEKNKN